MIEALLVLAGAVAVSPAYIYLLTAERSRVDNLLGLLESKAAPAEYAAYVAPAPQYDDSEWLVSADGLVAIEYEHGGEG